MSAALPEVQHLALTLAPGGVLHVTLSRPKVRNAMSLAMVTELEAVLDAARAGGLRVLVLRGAGGHFCAGGDVSDMASARGTTMAPGAPDPVAEVSRRFGTMITKMDRAPQVVIAVLEGAVLGGGMGLACVADVAIAKADARFGLPETRLGLPPAQIAPFLVQRLGRSTARRLAVTGGRFDGKQAHSMGLVHHVCEDDATVDSTLHATLSKIRKCAPGAVAMTKALIAQVGRREHEALLDDAAQRFAEAVRGVEGMEGTAAFLGKRTPSWAEDH